MKRLVLFFLLLLTSLAYGDGIDCQKGGFKIEKADYATIYSIDPDNPTPRVFMTGVPVKTTSFGYSSYYRAFYAVDLNDFKLKAIERDSSGNPVVRDVSVDATDTPGKIAMGISPDGRTIYVRKKGTSWDVVVLQLTGKYSAREVRLLHLENPNGYQDPGYDLSINPGDGHIYIFKDTSDGVFVYDENTGALLKHYQLDTTTNNVELPDSPIAAGSQWFDGQGRLYAWLNRPIDGKYHLWRMTFNDITGKAVVEDFVLNGNVSGLGDGAGCSVYGTEVSGHVFEDVTGDGLADGDSNPEDSSGDQRAISGARVYLYDSSGRLAGSTVTDSRGRWSFHILSSGDYYVVVDSKTLSPSSGFNSGYGQGDVWAEQTYFKGDTDGSNSARGLCDADGNPSTQPQLKEEGACYGGAYGDRSDNAATLGGSEHKALIHIETAEPLTGIDFGFSYNVVTNVNDRDDDSGNRTCQGCLRQFIQNANAISGPNRMRFVPVVPENESNWWKVVLNLVDNSQEKYALPPIEDDYTTVDGTAYSKDDGTTVLDTNTSSVSAPGPVGTQRLSLSPYLGPELEVDANGKGSAFVIKASNTVVKKLAVFHTPYDSDKFPAAVVVDSGQNNLAQDLFIGARADGSSPASDERSAEGVVIKGHAHLRFYHGLIAYIDDAGVSFMGEGSVERSYIHHTGLSNGCGDSISFEFITGNEYQKNRDSAVVRDSYIEYSAAYGIESWLFPGSFSAINNTITKSGRGNEDGQLCQDRVGGAEQGGIRVFGSGNLIKNNVIFDNPGSGVVVVSRGSDDPSIHNEITENSFYSNLLSIDLDQTHDPFAANTNPNGDGVTPNDGVKNSNQQNEGLDYPVFTSATLDGNTLHVEGFVGTPSRKIEEVMKIEVYLADDDGNNNGEIFAGDGRSVPHGEGKKYLASCNTSSDGTFSCDLTVSGLSAGDSITGITIDSQGNTSEFSADYRVAPSTKITGYVYEDRNHDRVRGRGERGISGVRVELWYYNGSDWSLESTTQTDSDGYFEFSPQCSGTYRVIEDYADGGGNSPDRGSDPPGYISTTPNVVTVEWDGSENRIVEFGDFHGSLIEGTVFDDSGDGSSSSGEANNAILDRGEKGIKGAPVSLCLDEGCSSPIEKVYTDGSGKYSLWVSSSQVSDGQELYVVEEDLNGYTSTGSSVGSTVESNPSSTLRQRNTLNLQFSSGNVYRNYNFGDVKRVAVGPHQSFVVSPGDSLTIRHRVNINTPGSVSVMIASADGWDYAVYNDADCDGRVDGEAISPDDNGYYHLDGGNPLGTGEFCFILKTVVPTSVSNGTLERVRVIALEDWKNTAGLNGETGTVYDDSAEVGDTVTVSTEISGALRLEKWVRNVTRGEGFTRSNRAEPCDVLEYRISFKNIGTTPVKGILISDNVPRGTSFLENQYNGGSSDVLLEVEGDRYYGSIDDEPDYDGVFLKEGAVEVDVGKLTGGKYQELQPGQEGYLLYRVRLDGNCNQ